MKWVLIENRHINMNNVDEFKFKWEDGVLVVFFNSNPVPYEYEDPDRRLYLRMCQSQGVRPCEEVC